MTAQEFLEEHPQVLDFIVPAPVVLMLLEIFVRNSGRKSLHATPGVVEAQSRMTCPTLLMRVMVGFDPPSLVIDAHQRGAICAAQPLYACIDEYAENVTPSHRVVPIRFACEQVDVNGHQSDPLFAWLKAASGVPGNIPWNFTKFLVVCGNIVKRYSHEVLTSKRLAALHKFPTCHY